MHRISSLFLFAAVTAAAGVARADDAPPQPVVPRPESALERAAQICNELWFYHGTATHACTVISGETKATTTILCLGPLTKMLDGTYECRTKSSVVTRQPKQPPQVQLWDSTLQLSLQGQQVVLTWGTGASGFGDYAELGNGVIFRYRGVGAGDIVSSECIRRRDGSYLEIQRYKGLAATVTYEEVPVPPELQPNVQQASAEGIKLGVVD